MKNKEDVRMTSQDIINISTNIKDSDKVFVFVEGRVKPVEEYGSRLTFEIKKGVWFVKEDSGASWIEDYSERIDMSVPILINPSQDGLSSVVKSRSSLMGDSSTKVSPGYDGFP